MSRILEFCTERRSGEYCQLQAGWDPRQVYAGGATKPRISGARSRANSMVVESSPSARHGPGIVDIELDNLAGKGCCGHQRHALRRLKAVPRTLRINRDHPGAESEGLGPILW